MKHSYKQILEFIMQTRVLKHGEVKEVKKRNKGDSVSRHWVGATPQALSAQIQHGVFRQSQKQSQIR